MVATKTRNAVTRGAESAVTQIVTDVTFTEGLLRVILPLTADQQFDLVSRLASGGGFKKTFDRFGICRNDDREGISPDGEKP